MTASCPSCGDTREVFTDAGWGTCRDCRTPPSSPRAGEATLTRADIEAAARSLPPLPELDTIRERDRKRAESRTGSPSQTAQDRHDLLRLVDVLRLELRLRLSDDAATAHDDAIAVMRYIIESARAGEAEGGVRPNHSQMRTVQEIAVEHRQCDTDKYSGCYAHWPTPHCRADGMAWPCDVDLIRAALVSPEPDEEAR
jgi:hypothetical protein